VGLERYVVFPDRVHSTWSELIRIYELWRVLRKGRRPCSRIEHSCSGYALASAGPTRSLKARCEIWPRRGIDERDQVDVEISDPCLQFGEDAIRNFARGELRFTHVPKRPTPSDESSNDCVVDDNTSGATPSHDVGA
jgi:hypothetical protein